MKLTISTRLTLATAFLCALILAATGAGVMGAQSLGDELSFITGPAWQAADGAMEGSIGLQRQIITVNHIVSKESDTNQESLQDGLKEARKFTAHAFAAMRDSNLIPQKDLQKLDDLLERYSEAEINLIETHAALVKGNGTQAELDKRREQFEALAENALQYLEKLEEVGDSQVESRIASVNSTRSSVSTTLTILAVVGILLGIGVVILSRLSIAQPIRQVAEQLRVISEVDGDLTVALPAHDKHEVGMLATYFNAFVAKLRKSISGFDNTAGTVFNESQRLQSIAGDFARSVQQQTHEIEQVASAISQMTGTIEEVARNAGAAAQSARDADSEARGGVSRISRTRSMIGQLQSESDNTTRVIQSLRDETENIGSVISVIRSIAEQTNLLALNAAIEAARAGEQGRGFAVVADEVRTLATRTQQSTQDIQQMIERLQSGAQSAVSAIANSSEITRSCVAQTTEMEQTLHTITSMISDISTMNMQISTATDQQSAAAKDVNASISRISQGADTVSAAIRQNAASSAALTQTAESLRKNTAQFKY